MNKIIFKDARITQPQENQPEQIKKIFPEISPVKKGDIVAIVIKEGGIPFVTDTTTLYKGMKLNGDVLDSITVASGIVEADSMIVISHGKGHPASGFGGAVKHLGMGCLDRAGKIKVHEVGRPSIDPEKCIQCGDCVEVCPWGAIDPPIIDHSRCCGELSCADACKQEAIIPPHDASEKMQKRLGEAASGTIKALKGRIGYINWVYDLTPGCDCFNFSGERFVEDIGILAGNDPVAIDSATIDLINERMKKTGKSIYHVWGVDPFIHLEAAEKIGCGSRKY
jgi:uncharacterized Fe-S center protein